jgi:YHS domain-containing protein
MTLKNIVIFVVVAVLSVSILSGCSGDKKEDDSSTPKTEQDNTTTKPEVEGMGETETIAFTNKDGKIVCAVMGTELASEKDAVNYSDFEGVRYYFCCDGCKPLFDANPEKYAGGAALDGAGSPDDHGHDH